MACMHPEFTVDNKSKIVQILPPIEAPNTDETLRKAASDLGIRLATSPTEVLIPKRYFGMWDSKLKQWLIYVVSENLTKRLYVHRVECEGRDISNSLHDLPIEWYDQYGYSGIGHEQFTLVGQLERGRVVLLPEEVVSTKGEIQRCYDALNNEKHHKTVDSID